MAIGRHPLPHKLISSDGYWEGPPEPEPNIGRRIAVIDALFDQCSPDISQRIGRLVTAFADAPDTYTVTPVLSGATLPMVGRQDRAFVWIVTDTRRPAPTSRTSLSWLSKTAEIFDQRATDILAEPAYRGPAAGLVVDNGNAAPVLISRSLAYCTSSWTGRQLTGADSEFVGKRGGCRLFFAPYRVGTNYGTGGRVKVAQAKIIRHDDPAPKPGGRDEFAFYRLAAWMSGTRRPDIP